MFYDKLSDDQIADLKELGIVKVDGHCIYDMLEEYAHRYFDISAKDDKHYSSYVVRCRKKGIKPLAKRSQTIKWLQSELNLLLSNAEIREVISIITKRNKNNLKDIETYEKMLDIRDMTDKLFARLRKLK